MMSRLHSFPSKKGANLKQEWPVCKNAVICLATLLEIPGFVLSDVQYGLLAGQTPGNVFVPLEAPIMPDDHAPAIAWTRYTARKKAYDEQNTMRKKLLATFLASLDADQIALVSDPITGTTNKTVKQMMATLSAKYDTWLPKEIEALKAGFANGAHAFNVEESIDIYMQRLTAIHAILAANLNTIPELDKVGHVIREMSKLNSQQLNLWIMRYESENATVASKQFAPFSTVV